MQLPKQKQKLNLKDQQQELQNLALNLKEQQELQNLELNLNLNQFLIEEEVKVMLELNLNLNQFLIEEEVKVMLEQNLKDLYQQKDRRDHQVKEEAEAAAEAAVAS